MVTHLSHLLISQGEYQCTYTKKGQKRPEPGRLVRLRRTRGLMPLWCEV